MQKVESDGHIGQKYEMQNGESDTPMKEVLNAECGIQLTHWRKMWNMGSGLHMRQVRNAECGISQQELERMCQMRNEGYTLAEEHKALREQR